MTGSRVVLASISVLAIAGAELGAQPRTPTIPSHPRELAFPEAAWQPPAPADHRVALAGGATAYVVTDHTLPLVDLVLVARTGAYLDPPRSPGLAELTATMLRRGGTRDLGPDRFDRRADELGAKLGSQATMLYGAATLRATTSVLDDAVALLFDMLERPAFDAARLSATRRNMIEGMSRRNLDPLTVLQREWDWLLYGADHFSTRPMRPVDLERLERRDLVEFHRRYWRPENFWIAAAGAIDADRLRSLVEPRLAAWGEAAAAAAVPWPPPAPEAEAAPGLYHASADIPQVKIALGHRAGQELPDLAERVRLEVVAELLGGRGAISRLNGRLRSAEGLVYRVSARLDPGDLWPADYQIFFDTLDRDAPRAVAAALEEIDRLRTTLPHPEELAVVQRELLARRRLDFDTAEEAAGHLVRDALVARDEAYRSRYRELVEAVSGEAVRATAARHLRPDRLVTLVVGRWPAAGGRRDAEGWTQLERILGHRVRHLPGRDPLTLEPSSDR